MKTYAILGLGSRGRAFANKILKDESAKLVAIVDVAESSIKFAKEKLLLSEEQCFNSVDSFFAKGKICDALFICTQDADHYDMTIEALNLGYDVCLEKPAGVNVEECIGIRDTANRLNRKVMITHVLRYTPFYQYIKKTVDSGVLGEISTINQTENIAYWHFGLSFVRGPWRKMECSTPTIVAKCCHDLDIIKWIMDKKCVAVSSFGSLFHFRKEKAPKGSAPWCVDCQKETKEQCLYNAYKIYPEGIKKSVIGGTAKLVGKNIERVIDLKQDDIGKCVYYSDNDAIDNQVVNMQFENGATAHLTMCAFSQDCTRVIKVHGTKGEIYGDVEKGILTLQIYGKEKQEINVKALAQEQNANLNDGHGGGDYFLYKDFVEYLEKDTPSITRTTIDQSIESHIIGFLAEESRKNNGKVFVID